MPLYVVRWPAFNVSLVRARNEEELMDLLDEVADPGACRWDVYKGPLWIDLDLPVGVKDTGDGEPRSDADVDVVGAEKIDVNERLYDVSIGGEETGGDMVEEITRWAFPHLQAVLDAHDGDEPVAPSVLADALRQELRELLRYNWRADQVERRSDPEAATLKKLGLTTAPPWLKRKLEAQGQGPARGRPPGK